MNDVTVDTLAAVAGALSHPGRLRILAMLREGDLYVCQIRAVLGAAASTVSAHLAILRRSGVVIQEKEGRWVRYRLTREEPLGSIVREFLYLVKQDRQILDDDIAIATVRRAPLDSVCRGGFALAGAGSRGSACRRQGRPAPAART